MSEQIKFSENETFIRLIQLARDDRSVRDQLLTILRLNPDDRGGLLRDLIDDMKAREAPDDFIRAFVILLDPEIADKVFEMLND